MPRRHSSPARHAATAETGSVTVTTPLVTAAVIVPDIPQVVQVTQALPDPVAIVRDVVAELPDIVDSAEQTAVQTLIAMAATYDPTAFDN
jgi:hypothetical protein